MYFKKCIVYRFRQDERERLEVVRHYLAGHLHETVRVETLCALAIMSRRKLIAGCERYYGKPIRRYLLSLRMEKAKELLLTTEDSIGAIATASGYQHQGSFSEAYKQYHGLLPREERKRCDSAEVP